MLTSQEISSLRGAKSKHDLATKANAIRDSIICTFPESNPNRALLLQELDELAGNLSANIPDDSTSALVDAVPEILDETEQRNLIRNRFYSYFDESFWTALDDVSVGSTPLSAEERDELLSKVFEDIISSDYSVDTPVAEIVANKGHGVARTIPVFSRKDYIVYFFCIKELEPLLKRNRVPTAFGGWGLNSGQVPNVGSTQEQATVEDSGYPLGKSFNPRGWSKAFSSFSNSLYHEIDKGGFSYVLQFDLSNYYDSIRLDTLERWIRAECGPEQCWVVTLLFYFLNQWNRKRTGLHSQAVGLPQDLLADCSRLLSSFYLSRYDGYAYAVCLRHSARYFRYADDQFVLMEDSSDLEKLVMLLTRRLDQYGLRVNQKKVRLWGCAEFERHRLRDLHAILDRSTHRRNPERVLQYATFYLSLSPEQLEASWNGGMPALTRLLWCNLDNLSQRQYLQIIDRLLQDTYLAQADAAKLRRIYEICADEHLRSMFAERLNKLSDKIFHNAFHYHLLAFAEASDMPELRARAFERLVELHLLAKESIIPVYEY